MIEEVTEKVRAALNESGYEALLVFGPDNVQYLSGAHLPFAYSYPDRSMALLWPRDGEPVCVCPVEWESSFKNLSWIGETVGYTEMPADHSRVVGSIVELTEKKGVSTGKMGIDLDRVSVSLYKALDEALPNAELSSCDGWLRELRAVKTRKELELLEDLAYRCDHTIFGVAHHVLVTSTRSEMSLSEEIRVHAMERELDVVGHHSVGPSASGEHARKYWPLAPNYGIGFDKHLKPGEYVRMELRTSLDGYWSEGARMIAMGRPTEEQLEAYGALVELRKAEMATIKPGVICS
jgi:Xaa-Pro aminopeptidase